jgi:hypothetical protein
MKISATLAAAAAAVTIATAAPALADRIDARQANQMQRIEQGLRSGQLTRDEYHRLMDQQREIARLERILERDGRLSYSDRARLNYLQNQASASIWWEKHDSQTRYNDRDRGWGWGRGWYGYGYGRGYDDYGYGYGYGHAPRRWYQWY